METDSRRGSEFGFRSEKGSDDDGGTLAGVNPEQLLDAATDFARQSPHVALASACAIGFLLGGGITPRLVGTVGLLVARKYVAGNLMDYAQTFVRGLGESRTSPKHSAY